MPSTARMYDHYLGGRDDFAADRRAAERVIEAAAARDGNVPAAARGSLRVAAQAGWEPYTPVADVQDWVPPGLTHRGERTGSVRVVGGVARRGDAS